MLYIDGSPKLPAGGRLRIKRTADQISSSLRIPFDPGIPDGAEVAVTLRQTQASAAPRAWGEGIRGSAGIAADIEGFDEAFAQIERERKAAKFRDAEE